MYSNIDQIHDLRAKSLIRDEKCQCDIRVTLLRAEDVNRKEPTTSIGGELCRGFIDPGDGRISGLPVERTVEWTPDCWLDPVVSPGNEVR